MMTVPKMRTISAAFAELKSIDVDTALTECAVRRLVREGKIPSKRIGRKILVNIDEVITYLTNDEVQHKESAEEYGCIRRVD